MAQKKGLLGGNNGSNSGIFTLESSSSQVETKLNPRKYQINPESSSSFFLFGNQQSTSNTDVYVDEARSEIYFTGSTANSVFKYTLDQNDEIFPEVGDVNYKVRTIFEQQVPSGIHFKDDGTKVYTIGTSPVAIHQYSLSTAWDLSTISYDSKSFTVSSQDTAPRGMFIRPDTGTTLYVLGDTADRVYQYSLSTAWDISTATYSGTSYLFSAQTTTPTDFWIGDSGTKLYIVGSTSILYQYTLNTAWSLASVTFVTSSSTIQTAEASSQGLYIHSSGGYVFSVGNSSNVLVTSKMQTRWSVATLTDNLSYYRVAGGPIPFPITGATGLFFSSDGTKVYIIFTTANSGGSRIAELSMNSAWDPMTICPVNSVNTKQIIGANGLASSRIGPNGEDIYAFAGSKLYDIPLSTPYDLSSALLFRRSSISTQEGTATGLFFKSDGTRCYVIGTTNDRIYQYELITPWNINTSYYSGSNFLVSQDGTPQGIFFKDDGTKVYVLGGTNNTVYQYSLSVAWDITTVTYDTKSFSVNSQDTAPREITFKSDGTKLYMMGSTNDRVYQYSLSVAWDISTASYDNVNFSVTAQETAPSSIVFKDDGTKLYICGNISSKISQYSLGTAWDISTASYDDKQLSLSAISTSTTATSLFIGNSGSIAFIVCDTLDRIESHPLRTAWDISTGTKASTIGFGSQDATLNNISFKPDGTKVYLAGASNDRIYQYSLNPAWDITNITYDSKSFATNSFSENPRSPSFFHNGTVLSVCESTTNSFAFFYLTTPWDVSTARPLSYDVRSGVLTQGSVTTGMFFKSDGTAVYVCDATSRAIHQYELSTPWDITTMTYSSKLFSVFAQEAPEGIFIKPDGTKFYMIGATNDRVHQYSLSTPWDISTATYDSVFVSVTSIESTPTDLFFKDDGSILYVVGNNRSRIYEFSLGTAWNVGTATHNFKSYSSNEVSGFDATVTGIFFKPDGSKSYHVGTGGDTVTEHVLATPWDISSSFPNGRRLNVSEETVPTSVSFSADGKYVYVLGDTNARIFQYELSVPWNIGNKRLTVSSTQRASAMTSTMSVAGQHVKENGSKVYLLSSLGEFVVKEIIN